MKIALIILGVLIVVLIGIQLVRVLKYSKISKTLVDSSRPYSIKVLDPVGRFLVLGDSLAVGVGATADESLAGKFHQEFPAVDIYNKAVSGAKIKDVLQNLRSLGTGAHYNLIVIQVGANDIVHFTDRKEALQDLREVFIKSHEIGDKVVFISSGSVGYAPMFIEPFDTIYTLRSKYFFSGFKKVAEETDTLYVDLYVPKKDDIFNTDPDHYYAQDKFHLSGNGYAVWFEKIKLAFKNKTI